MKLLAKNYTVSELESKMYGAVRESKKNAKSHLAAIEKSASMQGNSQHRAQSGNNVRASGEYKIALSGALEIHELFPEFAKKEDVMKTKPLTTTQRQAKRRAALNKAAQGMGYPSWSAYETAVIKKLGLNS